MKNKGTFNDKKNGKKNVMVKYKYTYINTKLSLQH